MPNAENDQEIESLLKKAVENVEIPKYLIDECIAEFQKNSTGSGDASSPFLCELHENIGEEERAKRIFTNLSKNLNKIRENRPEDCKQALEEFLHHIKKESGADILTCYLSPASDLPTKNELNLFTQEGTWFPSKMRGLVKRRNIQLALLDKEPQVFEDAGADYIFSDSDFLKREQVKSVISLPFWSNSQRGIVFLSYRKRFGTQPEIGKLLINNVPRWLSALLSDKRTSPQVKSGCDQRIENRDFAELIKRTAAEGLTDERIGEILKTLSSWLNLGNVFFSWHEIDEEKRTIRLRYLYSSVEMEEPISYDKIECKLDDDQGIVAEAAQSGTYVLVDDIYESKWLRKYKNLPIKGAYPEICSELAVPLNRYDGIHVGVLNLESSEQGRFTEDHARQIEKIGQAIIIAAQTYEMIHPQNQDLAKYLNALFDTFILVNRKTALIVSEEVQKITDLALNFFNASAVDIWQYDHERREFSDESALSLSKTFKEKCDEQQMSRDDFKQKFQPRKDGISRLLMENPNRIKRIKDAADTSQKHDVSPSTIALGIRSLLGIPIAGPQSTYPDGVMWLRFDKVIEFDRDLIETAQKLAGFVHMLWNPLSYHLPSPTLDVYTSAPDCFQIGDRVLLTKSFMDDDQEYEENMRGEITGKDSFLYRIRLFHNHQHICVREEFLAHDR